MSQFKFFTQTLTQKNQILISYPHSELSRELIRQLNPYPHLEVLPLSDPLSPPSDLSNLTAIIHSIGFDTPSLAQTLSYTVVLYRLLVLANQSSAQIIIIVPSTQTHLHHTALTLINQFAKSFPLRYQLLEVEKKAHTPTAAYEIVKTFIHRHRPPVPSSVPPAPAPVPPFQFPQLKLKINFRPSRSKVVAAFFLLLTPWLISLGLSLSLMAGFFCSYTALRSTRLTLSAACTRVSLFTARALNYYTSLFSPTGFIPSGLGFPPPDTLAVTQTLSRTLSQTQLLQTRSRQLFLNFVTPDLPPPSLADFFPLVEAYSENLGQLQTDLKNLYLNSPRPPAYLTSFTSSIATVRQRLSHLSQASPVLPQLLALDSKTQFLVLVQDNTESRPSGGSIDSLILMTAEKGKLTQLQVLSAGSISSLSSGTIPPPTEYQTITQNQTWSLKDSNWDSDFPSVSRRAVQFVQKDLSFQPDVVVAANLTALTRLLEISGPVKLPSALPSLTPKNFIDQYHTHLKTHPSSPSLIFELTTYYADQVKQFTPQQTDKFLLELLRLLESREILITSVTFSSSNLDNAGWSGQTRLPSCPSPLPCISDYFYAADTNIGGNKTDFYLSKKYSFQLSLSPDQLISSYQLQYTNSSPYPAWPAGIHKNYLRLHIPSDSTLLELSLNGNALSREQYSLNQLRDLLVLGLIVETPPGGNSQVSLKTSRKVNSSSRFHYQFVLPNQPGSSPPQTQVSFTYPPSWFTKIYNLPSLASAGSLQYNTLLVAPFSIPIDLAPIL